MFKTELLLGLALAGLYNPHALVEVGQRAREADSTGARPVVVFDLDDTLINSRDRTARILHELGRRQDVRTNWPKEAEKLLELHAGRIRYELEDTFAEAGITDAKLLETAKRFWSERFFTDRYSACDTPMPGAPAYARWVADQGAFVVYLTGRDIPHMQAGTRYNLARNGFPVDPENTLLLMKPDAAMDDTEFKRSALERIKGLGEVVGVFENEPRNINLLHEAFPEAVAIYIDSVHSRKPDVPAEGVHWVRDFRLAQQQYLRARSSSSSSRNGFFR